MHDIKACSCHATERTFNAGKMSEYTYRYLILEYQSLRDECQKQHPGDNKTIFYYFIQRQINVLYIDCPLLFTYSFSSDQSDIINSSCCIPW